MTNEQAIANLKEQQANFNEHYVDFAGVNESYELAIRSIKKVEELEKAIEDIKAEIGEYYADCIVLVSDADLRCKMCNHTVFSRVLNIIDKHIGGASE